MAQIDHFGSPILTVPRRSLLSLSMLTPTPPRAPPARACPVGLSVALPINHPDEPVAPSFLLPLSSPSSALSSPRVSVDTVAALLAGAFAPNIADHVIVDCRYDYEHDGGHLPGAVSVNQHDALRRLFVSLGQRDGDPPVLVFHCEFSQNRAPKAFGAFRALDRAANDYPTLSFPQMFIMDGGYQAFFTRHAALCWPRQYVPMADPELSRRWRKQVAACRKSWTATTVARKTELGDDNNDRHASLKRCIF